MMAAAEPEFKKILVVASSQPRGPLWLPGEFRAIQASAPRGCVEFLFEPTLDSLVEALPHAQVVHFCGHGNHDGLVMNDDDGSNPRLISAAELEDVFARARSDVACVICNFCYSEDHAQLVAKHVGFATGVDGKIFDDDAIRFAQIFHREMWRDESYRDAHESAKVSVERSVRSGQIPILVPFGTRGADKLKRTAFIALRSLMRRYAPMVPAGLLPGFIYLLTLSSVPSTEAIELTTQCLVSADALNDAAQAACPDAAIGFKILHSSETVDNADISLSPKKVSSDEESSIYIYCDNRPILKTDLARHCTTGLRWYDDRWLHLTRISAKP